MAPLQLKKSRYVVLLDEGKSLIFNGQLYLTDRHDIGNQFEYTRVKRAFDNLESYQKMNFLADAYKDYGYMEGDSELAAGFAKYFHWKKKKLY